jgi:hypothetical protein
VAWVLLATIANKVPVLRHIGGHRFLPFMKMSLASMAVTMNNNPTATASQISLAIICDPFRPSSSEQNDNQAHNCQEQIHHAFGYERKQNI